MNTSIEISLINKHFFSKKSYNVCHLDKSEKEYISKITPYDFFSMNEIQISDIIENNIPYYSNYFNIIYDYDFIQIGQLNETIVEKMNINTKEKYLLMEFKKRFFVRLNDFLFGCKTPTTFILNTLNSFSYLLDSLIKLNKNNICFFNLSSENIVFDSKCGEKPILINFQKSLQIKKLNVEYITTIIEKTDNYTCKPFEVHVLFYLIRNKLGTISHSFIEEISEIYVNNLNVLALFSQSYKEDFKILCVDTLKKYINKPTKIIIQDIIERTGNTWDNYSFSILYLHIFGNISRIFSLKGTFIGKISNILSKNIHPEPSKRESLEKTLESYENLYNETLDWGFVKKLPNEKMQKLFTVLTEES
jgi:hypothetical protein